MTNNTKTNNLNYLIDPTFNKVNRLFVLSFENEECRTSFSKYYTPKVEVKDFNVLIDGKSFFDVPVKSKKYTKNLLRLVKIVITQLVIYWTTNTFQSIINQLQQI